MARLKGGITVGKIGRVVYSQWNGIETIKSVPQRSKNSWTDAQLLHRERFAAINEYCGKNKYVIKTIWNLAAENGHGYNLFLKANKSAFALDGELAEIDKLHFSAGKLPLPQDLQAERSAGDPSKMEVSWINDQHLSRVYLHDELMMVCAYRDHFTAPTATGIFRGMLQGTVDLPSESEKITGIWLFFRSNKKDRYSDDQWFGI